MSGLGTRLMLAWSPGSGRSLCVSPVQVSHARLRRQRPHHRKLRVSPQVRSSAAPASHRVIDGMQVMSVTSPAPRRLAFLSSSLFCSLSSILSFLASPPLSVCLGVLSLIRAFGPSWRPTPLNSSMSALRFQTSPASACAAMLTLACVLLLSSVFFSFACFTCFSLFRLSSKNNI